MRLTGNCSTWNNLKSPVNMLVLTVPETVGRVFFTVGLTVFTVNS